MISAVSISRSLGETFFLGDSSAARENTHIPSEGAAANSRHIFFLSRGLGRRTTQEGGNPYGFLWLAFFRAAPGDAPLNHPRIYNEEN